MHMWNGLHLWVEVDDRQIKSFWWSLELSASIKHPLCLSFFLRSEDFVVKWILLIL